MSAKGTGRTHRPMKQTGKKQKPTQSKRDLEKADAKNHSGAVHHSARFHVASPPCLVLSGTNDVQCEKIHSAMHAPVQIGNDAGRAAVLGTVVEHRNGDC
jgi:hypothetical protein